MLRGQDTGPEEITRIVLRPMASPVPLGALSLAVGSLVVSALQFGWVPTADSRQVGLVVLVLVVPLEGLAAVFGFLIRDVVMATGFGLVAGAWTATGALLHSGSPGSRSPVLGVLAVAVGGALLIPAITASPAKPAAAVLMAAARGAAG